MWITCASAVALFVKKYLGILVQRKIVWEFFLGNQQCVHLSLWKTCERAEKKIASERMNLKIKDHRNWKID